MFKVPFDLNSFLSMVASDVFDYYNQRLPDVLFILPNRRSSSVFKEELVKVIDKPLWSPQILSINDWFVECEELEIADDFECLVNLYSVLKIHWPELGGFFDFLSWGEMLLKDFDELDKYLVPYKKIYRQLHDEKEIEERFSAIDNDEMEMIRRFWLGINSDPSENQKDWLGLWNVLATVAEEYIGLLKTRAKTSPSYVYRQIASDLSANSLNLKDKELCFIGFNALSKAEEMVIDYVHKSGLGRYYWDAGHLIKKYSRSFPSPETFIEKLNSSPNRLLENQLDRLSPIEIAAYESSLAQVKDLDQRVLQEGKTVVVLGEEEMVEELLWSLSGKSANVNISIGKPLRDSRFGNLLDEYLTEYNPDLDSDPNKPFDCIGYLSSVLAVYYENSPAELEYFEDKALEMFEIKISELKYLIANYAAEFTNEAWLWIMKKWLKTTRMPYPSNPNAQILITGILETRLLDFDNVFIVSMNEGVWPAKSRTGSFIPFHLRKEFGLPVAESLDDMYAYHFFRLIQRADNMNIAYVNQSDNLKTGVGELSRFIRQLEHQYKIPVRFNQIIAPASIRSAGAQSIVKTKELMLLLGRYLETNARPRMLSPSALNTYIDCGLKFFFQYLLSIKDGDEPLDLSEPRLFGKLLHEAMEFVYTQVINKEIVGRSDVDAVLKRASFADLIIKPVLKANSSDSFGAIDIQNLGAKDKLVIGVVETYLELILKSDLTYAPFSIVGLEKQVSASYPVLYDGKHENVLLGGYIDRLDKKGNDVRVIDYKSGKPLMAFQAIGDLINGAKTPRGKEILQTLIYSSILKKDNEYKYSNVLPGLYAMRVIDGGVLSPKIKFAGKFIESDLAYVEELDNSLSDLLSEIFDPSIDFTPTDNLNTCKYCSFKDYCYRN